MAKAIIDEQSLTDIADAIRTKNGSADTYTPSEMATAITDLPTPTPVTKGLVFSDYDSDGYPHKAEFVGTWTEIPIAYCMRLGADNSFGKKITTLTVPNGVTSLATNAFYGSKATTINLPQTVTSIGANTFYNCTALSALNIEDTAVSSIDSNAFSETAITSITIPATFTNFFRGSFSYMRNLTSITFLGSINAVPNNSFLQCNNISLFDFSHCTAVPPLYSVSIFGHKANCVIKVPQSLLAEWQTATNWSALTDVTWQGV